MKNIFKIIKISKPLHKIFLLVSILILIPAILNQVSPLLSKSIIDEIENEVQSSNGNLNKVYFLVGLIFLSSFFSRLFESLSEKVGDYTSWKLREFLVEKFYHKILTLPQSYFDSELSGKIVNQFNRGITTIENFSKMVTNFIFPSILQGVLTISLLFYYSPIIAILVFSLFPIYILASHKISKRWGEREVEKNKFQDNYKGRFQEVVSNMRLVKSFGNQKSELDFAMKNIDNYNKIYNSQTTHYHIFSFLRNLFFVFILSLVTFIIFDRSFRGVFSFGEMALIIQLLNQIQRPLFTINFMVSRTFEAEAGSKEFFEIMDLESTEDYWKNIESDRIESPEIEMNNVSFSYEGSKQIIQNMSFKIENGEKVALVGHSGAGKTTITNLILKFYEPTSGEILMNGKKYAELDHNFIRNQISLVLQDAELFSSTVKENVSYGKPDASDEEIKGALKKANAWDFVANLPKGIDSEIGERGVKLSGGQKQRVQIARAILKDSPILILDEATSNLDSKSESLVQKALENLMKGKLVIIIAHRLSTIQNVDKIFVIEEGEIVDSGSPNELAKKPGIYSSLLKYQVEGNKKLLKKFEIY